jgi:branched-chain amino acid transport system permease protein
VIVLQAAFAGILVGGLYALMAIGLSLTWGMLKVINLAHFGLILLSAYLTYALTTEFAVDPLLTLGVTAPVMFALAAALQWGFQRFRVGEFNSLLISFGVLIMLVQAISNVWTADFRRLTAEQNQYGTGAVAVGPLVFPMPTLLAFAAALVIVGMLHLALTRTFIGRAIRAFAEDPPIAAAFGIDHRRIGILLSGAAGVTAAVAGTLFAIGGSMTPSTALEWIGLVFAIVILGGIGNVVGTLAAGALVGAVDGLVTVLWSPSAGPLVVFSLVVIALLFRPRGLLPHGQAAA